jgi:hypothetical protein
MATDRFWADVSLFWVLLSLLVFLPRFRVGGPRVLLSTEEIGSTLL